MEKTDTTELIASAIFELSMAEGVYHSIGKELAELAAGSILTSIQPNSDSWSEINNNYSKLTNAVIKIISTNNIQNQLASMIDQYKKTALSRQKRLVLQVASKDELPESLKSAIKNKVLTFNPSIVYTVDSSQTENLNIGMGWQEFRLSVTDIPGLYARGFVNFAKGLGILEKSVKEFSRYSKFYESNFEVQQFLNNPYVKPENKFSIIYNLLGKNFSNFTNTFVWLLIMQSRQDLLPQIAKEIAKFMDDYEDQVIAEITTAQELTDLEKEKVISEIEKNVDRKIIADFNVDENIIGGIKIQIGFKIFDGSVVARLSRVAREFSNKEVGVA